MEGTRKPKAFVVIPFDDEFTAVYDDLIAPALDEAGYDVERADTRLDQQAVMRSVVLGIATADLVIADVSGRNPNVMYELGIAHGLKRPTITITQELTDLPFDLRAYRAQKYSSHFKEAAALRAALVDIGKALRTGDAEWGSPVTDFAPDSLQDQESVAGPSGGEDLSKNEAEDDRGFLDYLTNVSASGQVVVNTLAIISAATVDLATKLNTHTERLGALQDADPGPGAVRQFQRIALAAGGSLDAYASQLEEVLPDLERETQQLVEGGLGYAKWLRDASMQEDSDTDVSGFRSSVRDLLTAVRESRDPVLDMREAAQGLRGVSQPLTQATHRVVRALDRVVATQDELIAFSSKTLALLGEDPESEDSPEGSD